MTEILKVESTLTDRYQTTVPDVVRRTLGLEKRDKICYVIGQDGTVKISRSEESKDDPVLSKFLDFIAEDIKQNPQHIQAVSSETVETIQSLVADVDIDLNAALEDNRLENIIDRIED